jgi:PLD-like domain
MPPPAGALEAGQPELYIQESIARRWEREVKAASRVLMFSPYVTDPCAADVLLAGGGRVELYTLFSARNFATGASSLDAVERLLFCGVEVYHLPRLHAKLLLVPGRFVSLGSQNLTRSGHGRNREASVVLHDPSSVRSAEEKIVAWLADGQRITPLQILKMRAELPAVRTALRETRRMVDAAEGRVWNSQEEREWAARRQWESEARDREEERRFMREEEKWVRRQAQERAHPPSDAAPRDFIDGIVTLCADRRNRANGSYRIHVHTLLRKGDGSHLKWMVGGGAVELNRGWYCPCFLESDGRLGWCRVHESRITFTEFERRGFGEIQLDGKTLRVWFHARRGGAALQGCNLAVRFVNPFGNWLELACRFDPQKGIEAFDDSIREVPIAKSYVPNSGLAKAVNDPATGIAARLLEMLVEPFRDDRTPPGVEADEFFGPTGTKLRAGLVPVQDRHFLVFRRQP